MPTKPRTLCLWLPNWPVQRVVRERPELAGKPLALCNMDTRAERVAACSAAAARLGVASGMKTPDAQGLAGPGRLVLMPHAPGADRRELERLAIECERFSPTVCLEDVEQPEAILCDITGLARTWRETDEAGEKALAEAALRWAAAMRLVAVAAIAPTVGLSLAAARWVAREAGPVLVASQDTRAFAASMPIEALRVDVVTIDALHKLGVESIGQLLELPRASLPARFGGDLARRLDQLLGDAPEPVEASRGEPPLRAVWEFESPVQCAQVLERVRLELLERLVARLAARRCGALRVLVEHLLDARGAQPVRVVLRLFRPTASARELAELASLHLEAVRFRHAVRAVHVMVAGVAPIDTRQRTLFDDDPHDDPHTLALLINRLASRLGYDRVLRVAKRRSVDPQRAYATTPATDAAAEPFSMTPREAQYARRLPITMPRDAEPIGVETDRHGEPVVLLWRGRRAVVRCWGPERIETGWWRGRGLRRDAWWVELEDGAKLWIHCDLRRRRWRLAGGV